MDLIFSIFFFLLTDSLENINRHKLLTQMAQNKKSPTFVEDFLLRESYRPKNEPPLIKKVKANRY